MCFNSVRDSLLHSYTPFRRLEFRGLKPESTVGKGQELWKRAKKVIPGGNMLLSKRAEMFLPEYWPAYYSKAEGCHVWDLDGRKLTDMSIMGIGTNLLGYSHYDVNAAAINAAMSSNMSTLNCPEEVYLAEKLVELHPWAGMVRFARSGGEANAIAVRIARAATGRDKVAVCGYHGWHDWYLATNLNTQDGLSEHLLPGLQPNGVPKSLSGTVIPFSYNNLEQLRDIASNHQLAAIKMEVQRSEAPNTGFLEAVRKICDEQGIVLIFDECTSGFRETFGGIHKKYNVSPDMAMFGKALGNGFAITAVVGKTDVMQAVQSSFISSTFWTERIGPSAALKTLDVMEAIKSWEQVTSTGRTIQKGWDELATAHGIKIEISGIPALSTFSIPGINKLKYKTLICQEMLGLGYLAATSCYVCTCHTPEIIEQYMTDLNTVFRLIADCEKGTLEIDKLLNGPACHDGFKRLN